MQHFYRIIPSKRYHYKTKVIFQQSKKHLEKNTIYLTLQNMPKALPITCYEAGLLLLFVLAIYLAIIRQQYFAMILQQSFDSNNTVT